MTKTEAIALLGGNRSRAARAIGVTWQAVHNWPDELSDRITDRVIAALARQARQAQCHFVLAGEMDRNARLNGEI